jgi:hypothetical protein
MCWEVSKSTQNGYWLVTGFQRQSTQTDTAGESFELNISAAQKVGMLTGPVRALTLAQRSVTEK